MKTNPKMAEFSRELELAMTYFRLKLGELFPGAELELKLIFPPQKSLTPKPNKITDKLPKRRVRKRPRK